MTWKTINISSVPKPILFGMKLIIALILVYFISSKLINQLNTDTFARLFTIENQWWAFMLALGLMPVNWAFEALKWQILIKDTQPLTFRQAYGSVLAGLSTGLVTPNRIGNFIGRNAYVERSGQTRAIYQTQLGNLAQFLISILVGLIGFVIVSFRFEINASPWFTFMLVLLAFGAGILVYFNPGVVFKIKLFEKLYLKDQPNIDYVIGIPSRIKAKILLISFCRYLVFIVQYNLLFIFFVIHSSWLDISCLSATTFLLTTLIPSLLFGKILVRESAALVAFGWAGFMAPVIVVISFLLWFINLALPATAGLLIWLKKSK